MFSFLTGALLAADPPDMLEQAQAAYVDYEFDKAAAYYRDAIALGIASADKLADARLIGTHIAFTLIQESAREPGPNFQYRDANAMSYWLVRTISRAALIAVATFAMIDAYTWSASRGRARARLRAYSLAFVGGVGVGATLTVE